jgi:hypothetical protein
MMNSYSISNWPWKGTKKPFFHLLNHAIPNSIIILASCSSNYYADNYTDIGDGPNTKAEKDAST